MPVGDEAQPKTKAKAEPTWIPKAEPKSEPKTEPKAEPKSPPKAEPKAPPKPTTQPTAKAQPQAKAQPVQVDAKTKPTRPKHSTEIYLSVDEGYWRSQAVGYLSDQLGLRGFRKVKQLMEHM